MIQPKVSIVVAFYNEEQYISKAIDSVLNQTYDNIELILVNDGSTDRSEAIINGYDDNRIKYICYYPNKRQGYARNRGIEQATGDYIMFFDADDILSADNVKKKVDFLINNPDIILVSNGYYTMDSSGNIVGKPIIPMYIEDMEIKAEIPFCNPIAFAGGGMIRRRILDEHSIWFNENLVGSEDYLFWVNIIPYGKVANLLDPLFCYRIGHSSHNRTHQNNNLIEYISIMEDIHRRGWEFWDIHLTSNQHEFLSRYLYDRRFIHSVRDFIIGLSIIKSIKLQLENNNPNGKILYKRYWAKLIDCTLLGRCIMIIYRRSRRKYLVSKRRYENIVNQALN